MKKFIPLLVLLLLLLCACGQKKPAASEESIPYGKMSPMEQDAVSRIQNGQPGVDGSPLRSAVLVNGTCYYGYLRYAEDLTLPTGAKYAGAMAKARCEEYTTPTKNLQGDASLWTTLIKDVYMYSDTPYFLTEKGEVLYLAEAITTAPPYYDDGRWMLEPPENE